MTTQDIIARVDRFLDSRNLADPSIRKRAIRKVVAYMNDTGSFIKGGQVVLPSDKRILANAYEQFKGSVLNSAEKSAINHMYEVADHVRGTSTPSPRTTPVVVKTTQAPVPAVGKDVEQALINGPFVSVNTLGENSVPTASGLYCIKLRKGVPLPAKYGKIREDGIIYIGKADVLHERLWKEELNHQRPATFFRGIGAILGFLPPKGSLVGKANQNNYKFSPEDTEAIRKWMRQSLLVNWVPLEPTKIPDTEKALIIKYQPMMNTAHNPNKNNELAAARKRCREYAQSK